MATTPSQLKQTSLIFVSLVAICVFGFLALQEWRRGKVSETWPAVDGRITAHEAAFRRRRRSVPRRWATHVEYTVAGQKYNGVFNDYETGETMTVYYDPANPENATTTRGVAWLWFVCYSLAALGGMLGIFAGPALAIWPELES